MNIVLIPAFFAEKSRPTLGSFFLEQAKALQRAGNQVTILYCDTYSVKCIAQWIRYEEETQQIIEGIKIYRKKCFCPLKHGMEGYREVFADAIIQLYDKYAAKQQTDIIHAHCCVWAGYAAMKLSARVGIPYVITEHATLFQLHKNEITQANNKVIAEAFRKASKVICVSKAFGRLLSEYRDDIEIIGNVVDCELFAPQAHVEKQMGEKRPFEFLTVCYMQEETQLYKKGIDVLLGAWKDFHRKFPDCVLTIGGGGHALSKAIEWCREYEIMDSVQFIGSLSREEVADKMRQCDCFVLPSRYETFGVVYIEAMACGKPVIAVRNGGPDDFINESNGILIRAEDVNELGQAMEQMVKDHDNYDSDSIIKYVKEHFSNEAIDRKLESVYRNVLGR